MDCNVIDDRGYRLKIKRIIPTSVFRCFSIISNLFLKLIPHELKYSIGTFFRRNKVPYCFLKKGDIVIQVGMPRDILLAGRSRAIYFSRFIGNGKVIVVEPDPENISTAQHYLEQNKLEDKFILFPCGAWSQKDTLTFLLDPKHPAANVLLDAEINKKRRNDNEKEITKEKFHSISVNVDTIDNLFGGAGLHNPKLVSITTNGAESQILLGMEQLIKNGVPYISLAAAFPEEQFSFMKKLGYQFIGKDDRGYSFKQLA